MRFATARHPACHCSLSGVANMTRDTVAQHRRSALKAACKRHYHCTVIQHKGRTNEADMLTGQGE
jgi:hypothetical protein